MTFTPTIPLSRQWFTWSPQPAAFTFQPLGLSVTPILYSTRAGRVSRIDPRSDAVRFGPHALDGSGAVIETEFAGTGLRLSAGTVDPFVARGGWATRQHGEWGARFWLVLAVTTEGGGRVSFDATSGAVLAEWAGRWAAIATRDPAIMVTGHATLDALCDDLERNGYFSKESRAKEGPVLGLRFNLDMMPEGGWSAAIADARHLAVERARGALGAPVPTPARLHEGAAAGALDAVRDIVGWNTLWDGANGRACTAVSRIWNLGGFAVWYNDQCYSALLAGLLDDDLARRNMEIAQAGATPQGNVASLVSSHDAWVDRSQPPLGGLVAWLTYLRTDERSALAAHYDVLVRNHDWWRRERDPDGSGLLSCGTSAVGDALYRGTHFAARNETGMDNSATHDEARLDAARGTLSTWDLGLNCAVALDAEMLGRIAGEIGRADDAARFAAAAARHRRLIGARLWDPERRIFANRQRDGAFVAALSPTSFYPMLCGAADAEQIAALLEHMDDPATFRTPFALPNATRDAADYASQTYWRGRVWPNVNFLVRLGLQRAGQDARAASLADEGFAMFRQSWEPQRIAGESYNAETGEVRDQGDTDPFYVWAALLPFMAVEEICGFSPWAGWTLSNGPDCRLGPLRTPLGASTVRREGGVLALSGPDGRDQLTTDHAGRLRHIRFGEGYFRCEVSARARRARVSLPGCRTADLVGAAFGGERIDSDAGAAALSLSLPQGGDWQRLEVWFRPPDGR